VATRTIPEGGSEREPGAGDAAGNGPANPPREPGPRIIPLRGSRGMGAPSLEAPPPPDGVEALYYEGMAAYQHRHWEEALDRFSRLKELQPSRPGLDALLDEVRWFLQLQAAAPAGGIPGSETDARRGWRAVPWPTRARTALYIVLGILAVSGILLVAFGDRLPWRVNRAAEELYNRGQARVAVGDYEGAQAAFEKMLEASPGDPEAKLGLERAKREQTLAQGYAAAEAAIAEEDWDRASAELSTILQIDPNYRDAQARLEHVSQQRRLAGLYADGGRLYDLGQWEQALQQFEKVRSIDGSYRTETLNEFLFVCYLNAGEALLKTEGGSVDDVKAAVDYFGKALAIHPRNRTATDARRLGGLYLDALQALSKGESDPARSQLAALVTEVPAYAGGQAAKRLYELTVAAGRDSLAAGDIPAALDRFGRAQALPVRDNGAARQGLAVAQAATPTASPTRPSTPTLTAAPTPWASVPSGPIDARSGPDHTYPVIGQMAEGAVVTITGRRNDGAWLRVCCTADGNEAWVASPLLEVQGPLKQAEVVTPPTATATKVVAAATRIPRSTPTPNQSVCVQGSVLNAAGGQGLAGWLVRLVDASGVERLWRTKASGFYRFSDIAPGPATVSIDVPPGWRPLSPVRSAVVAAAGPACLIVDFWNEETSNPVPTPPR
jgi:tetratricopeptide (TPR) repeat protein